MRGEEIDHRSDIFSFGAVLYEMLTGRRAFSGSSHVETMSQVLHHEPPPFDQHSAAGLSPGIASIVLRCLEKRREERFESARDLGFSLSAIGASLSAPARESLIAAASRRKFMLAAGFAIPAAAAGLLIGRGIAPARVPRFQRLTYRRGTISSARFASDHRSVVYAAVWNNGPLQIYFVRPQSPESASLGFHSATVLAVSRTDELALALHQHYVSGFVYSGMLARAPLSGGSPREITPEVEWADWTTDGSQLAIVRHVDGRCRLEFPVRNVLYETGGWISDMRFSPDGNRIGFLDHPTDGDNGGTAAFLDRQGRKTVVSDWFEALEGMSWSPDGRELWFTGARTGANLNVYATSRAGHERLLFGIPGWNRIADTSPAGHTLMSHGSYRWELYAFGPALLRDTNLSWYEWSLARDISNDGRIVLFDETGEGGGANAGVYICKTDGSQPVRLGDGYAMSLSPDAQWALTFPARGESKIVLLPTGPGRQGIWRCHRIC